MKKQLIISTDGVEAPRDITLGLLSNMRHFNQAMYPDRPITYLHVLQGIHYAEKNGKKLYYTYDESVQIMKDLGVDAEKHVKFIYEQNPWNPVFKTKCENCGHVAGWHYGPGKCCDGKCDCETFVIPQGA